MIWFNIFSDPDYEEDDSGEEDDHSRDTDFVIPGIKPSASRGRDGEALYSYPILTRFRCLVCNWF